MSVRLRLNNHSARSLPFVLASLMVSLPLKGPAQPMIVGNTPDSPCSFDVSSIRRSPGDQQTRVREEGNGSVFRATSMPAIMIVYNAFQVKDHRQVDGYPQWVDREMYDVLAKTPESGVNSHCLNDGAREAAALRELLVQRFGLRYHIEQKTMAVYALSTAKSGPRFKESILGATDRMKFPDGQYWFTPPATIRLQDATISKLSGILSNVVGRDVEDQTGLKGHYDLELKWDHWTPPAHEVSETLERKSGDEPESPPIFSAIQEQLGLRLTSVKILLPVFIIDHMERPSPN